VRTIPIVKVFFVALNGGQPLRQCLNKVGQFAIGAIEDFGEAEDKP